MKLSKREEKKFKKIAKKYKTIDEDDILRLSIKHAKMCKKLTGDKATSNSISALLEMEFSKKELCIIGSLFTMMLDEIHKGKTEDAESKLLSNRSYT